MSKAKGQDLTHIKKGLDVQELQRAERALVHYVQTQEYTSEIQNIQDPISVLKKTSRLYKFDPVLTAEGILLCGVRSKGQQVEDSQPVILPKDHHITYLLVKYYHEMHGHSGREYLVSMMRQRYWIPCLRTTVRRYLSQCRHCRRLFSAPRAQRMADIPKERLATDQPPFSDVEANCFGPFTTKLGRRESKSYGCILTCLTSRAVHIEVFDSMDTSSFINALQRFISRRGRPRPSVVTMAPTLLGQRKNYVIPLASGTSRSLTSS